MYISGKVHRTGRGEHGREWDEDVLISVAYFEVQVRRMDLFLAFVLLGLGVGGMERFPVNYVSLMAVVLCFDCMCCDLNYSVYLQKGTPYWKG